MHHGEGLFLLTKDRALVDALAVDYRKAALDAKDTAMLAYSIKLTKAPCDMGPADIETLRGAGFSDADIHDIAQTVAYYAFVNRMACGLGVELENYWSKDPG